MTDQMSNSWSRCPLCGNWEQTQPVPAIVDAQSAVTTTYGTSVGVAYARGGLVPVTMGSRSTGYSSTPLASALRFEWPRLSKAMPRWGWFLILFGLAWIAILSFGASDSFGQTRSSAPPVWADVLVVVLLGGWLPIVGVILLLAAHANRRRFRKRAPLVAVAAQIWSTARYCPGDHIVYLPDGAYTDPAGTRGLVFTAAQRVLATG